MVREHSEPIMAGHRTWYSWN